jgi:Peptidase family M28/Secretion system C-terminal sorting domain
MKTTSIFLLLFLGNFTQNFAQNQPPQLSNLIGSADFSTKKYTLNFDLADAENDSLDLRLELSGDDGQTYFSAAVLPMTGDVGFPIFQKNSAKIEVDLSNLPAPLPTNLLARLTALDRQPIDYQALVNEVDSIRLRDELDFVEGARHRTSNPTHLQIVRDSMKTFFAGNCFAVRDQPFSFGNYTAHNISGRHTGFKNPKKTVIIDAHYDTVSNSPGADDNGSGVVGTIEAARILAKYPTENTLSFTFFDLEESGLLGSKAFNNNVSGVAVDEQILGVFNYEMIGFYSETPNSQTAPNGFELLFPTVYAGLVADNFKGNFITNIANDSSSVVEMAFNSAAQLYVPSLKIVSIHIPGNWQNSFYQDLLRSDHVSFWLKNRPAIQLTDGANFRNLCYHTACDTTEMKLNFTFMSNVVKATVAASAKLAGIQHGSWKTTKCPFSPALNTDNQIINGAWAIFPNPTSGEIFIKMKNFEEETARIEISDLHGKLLQTTTFAAPFDEKLRIDLKKWPNGVYFLKIGARTERFEIFR